MVHLCMRPGIQGCIVLKRKAMFIQACTLKATFQRVCSQPVCMRQGGKAGRSARCAQVMPISSMDTGRQTVLTHCTVCSAHAQRMLHVAAARPLRYKRQ